MTRAASHIAAMQAYALADMPVPEGVTPTQLAQNECLRAPSPKAVAAAARTIAGSALYPDPDWTDLRAALAHHHGIPADGILCGNGSLDLIGAIARVYARPDRAILTPAHAYPFFRTAAAMAGARFDTAPEPDTTVDVDLLCDAVRPDTGIVCVANPGNPTGTYIPTSELRRLRALLRDDILLVIDEAYGEFATSTDGAAFDLPARGNTIVLRTFSKAYGLAGARVGWGMFPPALAADIRKVLNPNNVAMASQAAALAALKDQSYMRDTVAETCALRDAAKTRLADAGFDLRPSHTNFLLIDLGHADAAGEADAHLATKGIFLRRQTGAGLPHCLRMTIGPVSATNFAIDHLIAWQQETRP